MIVDDAFEVDATIERVWSLLIDIPKVTTCIPNAKLIDTIDDKTYRAEVSVKVGPVSVSYKATVHVEHIDEATHTASFRVKGDEARGRGGVTALVTIKAEEKDGRTFVAVHADAQISGIIASVGGRLIEAVAKKTLADFAANLAKLV